MKTNENVKVVGRLIRKAREAKGWTQDQLADAIGVKRSVVSKYETGIISLSVSKCTRIEDALGIKLYELKSPLNTLRDVIYEDAVKHGLWDKTDGPIGCSFLVSEEATELVNAGNEVQLARWRFSDDETEAWENYVEELADVIIASLSVAGKLGIDIDAAVRRKMEINRARPWKHGKEEQ